VTRTLAVVLTIVALFFVALIWDHGTGETAVVVLLFAVLAMEVYGIVVLHARHGFGWPFWVALLIGLSGFFWYGLWALFKFRFGSLPYRQEGST
jgi:hypothetical protein